MNFVIRVIGAVAILVGSFWLTLIVIDHTSNAPRPISSFAGPLPKEQFASTSVKIDRIELRKALILAKITILNNGSMTIPAVSSTGTPIRISVQYVGAALSDAALVPEQVWNFRQDINVDVPPGKSEQFDLSLTPPTVPGRYRVALSLVQEKVAWFHNRGMLIALSEPIIISPLAGAATASPEPK